MYFFKVIRTLGVNYPGEEEVAKNSKLTKLVRIMKDSHKSPVFDFRVLRRGFLVQPQSFTWDQSKSFRKNSNVIKIKQLCNFSGNAGTFSHTTCTTYRIGWILHFSENPAECGIKNELIV